MQENTLEYTYLNITALLKVIPRFKYNLHIAKFDNLSRSQNRLLVGKVHASILGRTIIFLTKILYVFTQNLVGTLNAGRRQLIGCGQ